MKNHPKMKVKARLKITASKQYKLQVQIENLDINEWENPSRSFQVDIRKKNKKKDSRLDFHLTLIKNKSMRKCLKQRVPYQCKGLEMKVTDSAHFFLKFEFIVSTEKQPGSAKQKTGQEGIQQFKLDCSVGHMYQVTGRYVITAIEADRVLAEYEAKKRMKKERKMNKAAAPAKVSLVKKKEKSKLFIEKGIGKTVASSFRRCENCYYYTKNFCGLMSLRVEEFNTCKRFYAPKIKIYSGGSFSSK